MHRVITLENYSLSFSHKMCFDDFSTQIHYGDKIAIMGRNGSGKSSLVKMIIENNPDIVFGYVPQVAYEFDSLSGGEKFNESLSKALSNNPSILVLDEPTNHLDMKNRTSLKRMISGFDGSLLIVSHDKDILRHSVNIIWHINEERIHVFRSNYDNYIREIEIKRKSLNDKTRKLKEEKRSAHESLMKEQERAKKSKTRGEKSTREHKWAPVAANLKAQAASYTAANKKKVIREYSDDVKEQLSQIYIPEVIVPKFSIKAKDIVNEMIVSIVNGSVGYADTTILDNINITVKSREKVALTGSNGSGKTTLIKAILGDQNIKTSGNFKVINRQTMGYLDQIYSTLRSELSVLDTISKERPEWSHEELRRHLNDYLFRQNDEVHNLVKHLSGGEKARLSLAQIGANTPKLLILDEVTNNVDLETRDHIVQALTKYPGAILIISHDEDFLVEIGIEKTYNVDDWKYKLVC